MSVTRVLGWGIVLAGLSAAWGCGQPLPPDQSRMAVSGAASPGAVGAVGASGLTVQRYHGWRERQRIAQEVAKLNDRFDKQGEVVIHGTGFINTGLVGPLDVKIVGSWQLFDLDARKMADIVIKDDRSYTYDGITSGTLDKVGPAHTFAGNRTYWHLEEPNGTYYVSSGPTYFGDPTLLVYSSDTNRIVGFGLSR